MKVVQINATCGSGSTGKICTSISSLLCNHGIENYILYSVGTSNNPRGFRYMRDVDIKRGALESRVFGNFGFNSTTSTKQLVKKLDDLNPDIVHIHNIHSHNCNISVLFDYLKKQDKKVVWTFHDCWAFTGCCTYFSYVGCNKWKTHCGNCPKAHEFSWLFDTSSKLYNRKKEVLNSVDMTIITPSSWLAELVKQSFLKNNAIEVINNGIDLTIFKPTQGHFKSNHNIAKNEKMILGVGYEWGQRKGIDVFIELAKRLPIYYKIVLVGTNSTIDSKLPSNIISIHRTQNQLELAEIYSAADVFINPTREDNYPTVNMEALACGTPVITFNTGGSPEMLDATCGTVVEQEDIDGLVNAISLVAEKKIYPVESCLKKAEEFNQDICFQKYLDLYRRIERA